VRVLMTTDTVGGVWTYATELADALAEEGVEVVLAALGPPPPEPREVHRLPGRLEWQPEPWDDVRRTGERLLALAAEVRPDVVHLNELAHGALDWPAPVLVVAHSCVLTWWEGVEGRPAPSPEWDRYRAVVRRSLDGAGLVVAPTRALLADLRRLHGFEGPAEAIPNGVRDRFGAPGEKEPLVLGAGRLWDRAKALDVLDGAAARVEWPVLVAGDAGGAAPAHARALGRLAQHELDGWMRRAAIFAHPARYEPFGLAPLEAALAGCALVLGDRPSLREVWGDAAAYVPPGDADALAAALAALIAGPARRAELARRARERARGYDARRMARAYAGRYAALRARAEVPA
jgi:glycogen synthase